MNIPGGVELRTVPVSITSEAYVKMNEINLAFTTEDGYHQSASISRVNVMASTDFRTFSGQWSVTVPWQFEAMSNVINADFDASVDLSTGVDVVIDEFYVCAGKSKYGRARSYSNVENIESITGGKIDPYRKTTGSR